MNIEQASNEKKWPTNEGKSDNSALLCGNHVLNPELIKTSTYPADFIPNGASLLIGVDEGSPDGDCTVKGFYKDGEYHIQSVEYRNT